MNKYLYLLPIVLLLSLGLATAAVTECINAAGAPVVDNTGAWPSYNDTGVVTNVGAGNVCINVSDYNVNPTLTYNCDVWYDYVDGACSVQDYYVGYSGDGSATCVATGWVTTGSPVFVAQGYIVNTTIAAAPNAAYETNTGEVVPAKDACLNAYTTRGPTGYCEGDGTLNTNGAYGNVTAGRVCSVGTSVAPNSTVYCSNTWAAYVDGACTYARYYVGYVGDGTTSCVATNWVVRDPVVQITQGYIINTTINALISGGYVTNTGEVVPAKNACANLYTRMGPTGYCDGGIALDTNGSTLHVADGKVCSAGANVAPNTTSKCGTWNECVQGATSYSDYYVGYAGAGTDCSETAWVATGNVYDMPAGLAIGFTSNSATVCSNAAIGDITPVTDGINNIKSIAYAGLALLAIGIIVIVAFGLIQIFKGGNVDFMTITIVAISTGIVIIIAYAIIYFVAKALGA